jgi:hypothetical protein
MSKLNNSYWKHALKKNDEYIYFGLRQKYHKSFQFESLYKLKYSFV